MISQDLINPSSPFLIFNLTIHIKTFGLDLWQVGLDFRQDGLDFQQVGKL